MERISIFAHNFLAVFILVLLVGVASYTTMALTPVPKQQGTPGNVAGLKDTTAVNIQNRYPLEFRPLNAQAQIIEQGSQAQIWQSVSPEFSKVTDQLVEVYNPNRVDVEAYISVKVPQDAQQNLLVDMIWVNGQKYQLFSPGLESLPVQQITIPARQSVNISAEAIKLEPIGFPVNLDYTIKY